MITNLIHFTSQTSSFPTKHIKWDPIPHLIKIDTRENRPLVLYETRPLKAHSPHLERRATRLGSSCTGKERRNKL